jgi:hypothetical protein
VCAARPMMTNTSTQQQSATAASPAARIRPA